jgi:hypothetical protein
MYAEYHKTTANIHFNRENILVGITDMWPQTIRLTYVRVAVRILRVRQSTRASLCELINLKAAENEQQAEQLVTEGLHF